MRRCFKHCSSFSPHFEAGPIGEPSQDKQAFVAHALLAGSWHLQRSRLQSTSERTLSPSSPALTESSRSAFASASGDAYSTPIHPDPILARLAPVLYQSDNKPLLAYLCNCSSHIATRQHPRTTTIPTYTTPRLYCFLEPYYHLNNPSRNYSHMFARFARGY